MQNQINRLAIIHIAKKQVGIDDDAYRAILSGVGADSASDIQNDAQFNAVMTAFKNLGFKYQGRQNGVKYSSTAPGQNRNYISSRQEYYIRGLWDLASRARDEKSLRAIVKRIGKVDDISFLSKKSASAVILALRDICWKAGFNPDTKESI
jgi:hypothetical protein